MKNTLLQIAEGILDEANEATLENLESADSVQAYAENGMDLTINTDHAELIRTTCLAWVNNPEQTANDYYYDVERVLESDDVKTELVIVAAKTIPYAENLDQLCDRLNMTEKLASDAAVKLTDYVDTTSLPTFGGADIKHPEGIWSWDETRILEHVNGVWVRSKRES
mgnify:CR=1 FL=1